MSAELRSQSAPPAQLSSGLAPDMQSIVAYNPCRCLACGESSSSNNAWGAYKLTLGKDKTTVLHKQPHGNACLACKEASYAAHLPNKTRWSDLEGSMTDPARRVAVEGWNALRTGAKHPRFTPQSVKETTRVGYRWEETLKPLTLEQFARNYPGANPRRTPGVRMETLKNARGEPQEVVLVDSGEPPRVVIYQQTEAVLEDNHLQPSRQPQA